MVLNVRASSPSSSREVTGTSRSQFPSPIAAAEAARDTLAEAISVAGELPEGVGASLVEVARGAFTDGLHVAAIISVALP